MAKSSHSCELVKRGRRLYGAIYTLKSGEKVYFAYRKQSEIYRGKEKSISEGIRKEIACWAIDTDTLMMARARGIRFIGVIDRVSRDVYLTTLDNYFDRTKTQQIDYTERGGTVQRFLPLGFFQRRFGKVKL